MRCAETQLSTLFDGNYPASVTVLRDADLELPVPAPRAAPVGGPRLSDIAFGAFCLVVMAARYATLVGSGAPPGIDSGNWLGFGHALLGQRIRSSQIAYPPLVPLVVTGAVRLLGPTAGVALVAALASLVPALAVYLVLRSLGLGWSAVVLAGFLAVGAATGEAAAWGGFPQLIGIGLCVLFLWSIETSLRTGRLRHCVGAGCTLALLLATSHLIVPAAALGLAVLLAACLAFPPDDGIRPPFRRLVALGAVLGVAALPFLPLYLHLVRNVAANPAASSSQVQLRLGPILSQLEFIYRDFREFWRLAIAGVLFIPLVLFDGRRTSLWKVTTSFALGALAALALTREPRFLYLLPVAAMLAAGLWLRDLQGLARPLFRRVWIGATVVLAVALAWRFQLFKVQKEYYAVLTPGVVSGINWLSKETPRGSLVAVSTVRDAPLGWWVEGLGGRPTLTSSSLEWLNYPDERARANLANRIFGIGSPSAAGLALARGDGVRYVLVAKDWAGYSASGLAAVRAANPAAVALENASVVILNIGP